MKDNVPNQAICVRKKSRDSKVIFSDQLQKGIKKITCFFLPANLSLAKNFNR